MASPDQIAPWFVGETSIELISGSDYLDGTALISNSLGTAADNITLELFSDDCETLQNLTSTNSSIFLDPSTIIIEEDLISYTVEILEKNFAWDDVTGNYLTWVQDENGGLSTGYVSFCTRVNAYSDVFIISSRETLFNFSFDFTDNSFGLDTNLSPKDPEVITEEIDTDHEVIVCQCRDFVCGSYSVLQRDSLQVCFTITAEESDPDAVFISNMNMQLSAGVQADGNYFGYSPVWYGEGMYETNALTSTEVDDETKVLMVTTPIVGDFYLNGFETVNLQGNAFLSFFNTTDDNTRKQQQMKTVFTLEIELLHEGFNGCVMGVLKGIFKLL